MCRLFRVLMALVGAVLVLSSASAQTPPTPNKADYQNREKKKDYSNAPIVKQMMAFDKKGDGKLTKEDVTDPRLKRLFDMADANKDGVVTKEELIALAAKLDEEIGQEGRGRGPGPGGTPGFGPGGQRGGDGPGSGGRGPGGGPGGPGGAGGRGGFMPPQPGQIMPPFLQDMLKLTADQKKQFEELQKEVDAKLDKILTDDQKKQLKQMREGFRRGGPGGRGGPAGRGGPGGPGGPPDGGPPPDRPPER